MAKTDYLIQGLVAKVKDATIIQHLQCMQHPEEWDIGYCLQSFLHSRLKKIIIKFGKRISFQS